MISYLKNIYGDSNVYCKDVSFTGLPILYKQYSFSMVSIYDKDVIFVEFNNRFYIEQYKKQMELIESKFKCKTVLVLKKSKESQRKNLIENNLMFIEKNKYIYMPFLGLVIEGNKTEVSKPTLTPNEQYLCLYIFYNKITKFYTRDVFSKININPMTLNRCLQSLEQKGFLIHEIEGVKFLYSVKMNREEYLNHLFDSMINPVSFRCIIKNNQKNSDYYLAGDSLLSECSEINDNKYKTFATNKKIKKENCNYFEKGMILSPNEAILECWKYRPDLNILKDGDVLSVIKSFEEIDERTESIIDEIKEKLINE